MFLFVRQVTLQNLRRTLPTTRPKALFSSLPPKPQTANAPTATASNIIQTNELAAPSLGRKLKPVQVKESPLVAEPVSVSSTAQPTTTQPAPSKTTSQQTTSIAQLKDVFPVRNNGMKKRTKGEKKAQKAAEKAFELLDPTCPRKPPKPFMIYCAKQRELGRGTGFEAEDTEFFLKEWNAAEKKVRAPFKEEAKKLKDKYSQDRKKYLAKRAGKVVPLPKPRNLPLHVREARLEKEELKKARREGDAAKKAARYAASLAASGAPSLSPSPVTASKPPVEKAPTNPTNKPSNP